MLGVWIISLASVLVISSISFVGIFTLALGVNNLKKILLFLVSFSTGALLGGAFIHLLPEIIDKKGFTIEISASLLFGIILFFILEKFICWRHCHVPTSHDHPHPIAFMNLVGDAFHNFLDGMLIAGSYLLSPKIGIATTLAVILHEIPQEIGDFGILIHAGFTKVKALFYNFLSALFAVLGALLILIVGPKFLFLIDLLIPITAGGFIYIASSDLIPELHKETDFKKSTMQLVGILLGIFVMILLLVLD